MAEIILHSDLNCFYASVEMNENPSLRGKAIAVCGSTEDRHGIVLTASYPAKRMGVKTGAANWQAKQACPGLICVPPHYDLYLKYSKLVRRIYADYTDTIEPFGMDENWLSIPFCSGDIEGEGRQIAEDIRRRVREETGLTVKPESIKEYGFVLRLQKSDYLENTIFEQENFYYTCEVTEETGAQKLDDYEAEEGFTLEFVTPEEAIRANQHCHCTEWDKAMVERETRVLKGLWEELKWQ